MKCTARSLTVPAVLICSALLWGFAVAESTADKAPQAEAQEVFTLEQLRQLKENMTLPRPGQSAPPVYPWMLRRDLQRADWLNLAYKGKTLYEPINVIICDSASASAEDAEKKLLAACEKAGFLDRYGHSSDYYAYIAGNLVRPFPARRRHSLADKPFEKTNNHGRIFGPVSYKGKYYFAAAFSRERVHLAPPGHQYVSFNQARDAFIWAMDAKTEYKLSAFAELGNLVIASTQACTGDHDGVAAILEAAGS